jgi:cyanate lyase
MINKQRLKGKIVEKDLSYKNICNKLGIGLSTFYAKLNGKTEFTLKEGYELATMLDFNSEDVLNIFFNYNVA